MKELSNFLEIKTIVDKPWNIECSYLAHLEESVHVFKVTGEICIGFGGRETSLYLYQQLVLAIVTHKPRSLVIDLRELKCQGNTALGKFFKVFSDINFFGADEILHSFILSEQNNGGLAHLTNFTINNTNTPFFYDFEKGYNSLIKKKT
jgi:hypothetical protein